MLQPGRLGIGRIIVCNAYLLREADLREQPDSPEVGIELVPPESVARGDRVRMVVVVPALATREQGHPPAVSRIVASFKAAAAPEVRC